MLCHSWGSSAQLEFPSTAWSSRILVAIRQFCQSGCGRQALRVIDGDFQSEGPQRRQLALSSLHDLTLKPVNDISQVEPTITKLKSILMELRGSPEMPTDAFLLAMIRFLFAANPRLAPIFATYDLVPRASPDYVMKSLQKVFLITTA